MRTDLLELLASHRVSACFCGHYHRNGGGMFSSAAGHELEVVVTGACGVNVSTREVGNPLEIEGMGTAREVTQDVSGMRIVHVSEAGVQHRWYTFRELAKVTQATAAGAAECSETAREERPGKRRKAV